jgi:hypothetical protein
MPVAYLKKYKERAVSVITRTKGEPVPESMLKPPKKKSPQKSTKPAAIKEKKEKTNEIFKCSACGEEYKNQQQNFAYSYSPYYAGNNHRITICNKCLNSFTDQYQDLLKDQDEAIRRMCMRVDLYLDETSLQASRKIDDHRSRIKEYVRLQNLSQNRGKSYDDYLAEKASEGITSIEDFEEARSESDIRLTKAQLSRWGLGFTPDEYRMLDEHYKSLNEQRSSDDPMQEVYVKDLCEIKVLQVRALNANKLDDWSKYKTLYQNTAKAANLNPKQQKDIVTDSEEDCWGKYIADIEKYAPAEYYKDKKMFADFSGIGEYVERFLLRPLKNLITGSKDMDAEYVLDEDIDGGDGG